MEHQDIYQKLINLLEAAHARYRVVTHAPEGQTERVSALRGNLLAQAVKSLVVLVKIGKKESRYVLVNVPGDRRADLNAVKTFCGGTHVMFAPEEKARALTGCAMGAVPPFSFDPNLALILDSALLAHDEFVFNAGRLDRSIFIHKEDYLSIAQPMLATVTLPIQENDK